MSTNGNHSAEPIGETPRITVEWDDHGTMHMVIEGKITPDHLVMAAFHLHRTANGILDSMERQRVEAPPRIIPAHSMPGGRS